MNQSAPSKRCPKVRDDVMSKDQTVGTVWRFPYTRRVPVPCLKID